MQIFVIEFFTNSLNDNNAIFQFCFKTKILKKKKLKILTGPIFLILQIC